VPIWAWATLAAGVGWLFLSRSSSYPASTSQGDVSSRTDADWQALWALAQRLGVTPQVLGLVLYEESGMDPGAKNTNGSSDPNKWCVGLNQFCPGTYESWVSVDRPTYLTWSMAQQLGPIGAFWASKPSFTTARDLFWLNFLPASYVEGASPDTVVNDPTKMDAHYATVTVPAANTGLFQGRSVLTAGDIDAYLASYASSPGWQLALQKIAENAPSGENA
jgi:hypothetical protein